nr:hypothetical protein [Ceratocystis fimbriata]WPM94800.1 hypothetical protein [Ceratocystis fimbriata]
MIYNIIWYCWRWRWPPKGDVSLGFTRSSGCFTLKFHKRSGGRYGWDIIWNFIIVLHISNYIGRNTNFFFFCVGRISKQGQTAIQYQVSSVTDLQLIVEHFYKFPLITKKLIGFLLFKDIVYMVLKKEHLTQEGILKLVAIKATMNKGLPSTLKEAFPNVKPVPRPSVE